MKYKNPVIKGFYPDPSVCKVNGKYYLVCSSMQYFPAVPLFESEDLINWKQIGNCLTRESQIALRGVNSSGGVFAPTIRYNNGRFYMVTTNSTTQQNFYVYTNDIYAEWSEPIYVNQGGIDPSLYFEDGKTYFLSNGSDDIGVEGITQCEIDIETGEKLSPSVNIWQGTGGRYIESPHMYKIGEYYYLMVAEGGTEYGHMVTYARSKDIYGKFESYPYNPVLTNRNLGGFEIQGVGHGDLIQDEYDQWWILHLGFRQIDQWLPYHHLGRETFLTPVYFNKDGWFTAGYNGTTIHEFEVKYPSKITQLEQKVYTFDNTNLKLDWLHIRIPNMQDYYFYDNTLTLIGTHITLDDVDSPTFIGLRQKDFDATATCDISVESGLGGITIFMDEQQHYDLYVKRLDNGYTITEKLNVGDIKHIQNSISIGEYSSITLEVTSNNFAYTFSAIVDGTKHILGTAQTKYLSTEVASGFTGVIIGLYAQNGTSKFKNFRLEYLS
ncbi:MAG: glycoside hydrolase family 43 protein [Ruminococcus sp.]|nr:glycoside hydrolase family 43 protein [Ruminococcus sp.]